MVTNNNEAENSVLASLIINSKKTKHFLKDIKDEYFFSDDNQNIFKAIKELNHKNKSVDLISIKQLTGIKATVLSEKLKTSSFSSLKTHIDILKSYADVRWFVSNLDKNKEKTNTSNVSRLMSGLSSSIVERARDNNQEITDIKDCIGEFEKYQSVNRKHIESGAKYIGTPCGFKSIDDKISGIRGQHYWVVSAYCLAKGTKVINSFGEKIKVEDIKIGDTLAPVFGKKTTVTNISNGEDILYKIKGKYFDDFVVNSGHLLAVVRDSDYSNGKIRYIKAEYLYKTKNKHYRLIKHPLITPPKKLQVDPYFLGYWLGDGSRGTSNITVHENDTEIFEYIIEYSKKENLRYSCWEDKRNKGVFTIGVKKKKGSNKNITSKLPKNKNIPKEYMTSSLEQRLQLLAGLIDSDGSKSDTLFCFSQKDKNLTLQVAELANSCGLKTVVRKEKWKKGKSLNSIKPGYQEIYRVFISGNVSIIPNKLKRKKITKKKKIDKYNLGYTPVTFTVDKIGEGEYYGFTLDNNKLFLTDNFIVNHNTNTGKSYFLLNVVNNLLEQGKRVLFFSLEMSKEQNIARILGIKTLINPVKLEEGTLSEQSLEDEVKAKAELYEQELVLYNQKINIDDILITIYSEHSQKPVDLVVIDYIQKIQASSGMSRYERFTHSSDSIQKICQELGIPAIVASQVDNESARSGNKTVISTKGSGDIASDVDFALLLSKTDQPGEVECIIQKNRHGMKGGCILKFGDGGILKELN